MRYEWDEQKNQINQTKHGFDFADAYRTFLTPVVFTLDNRFDYGEDHWVGIGLLNGRVVKIVFTEPQEEVRRVISLRKAAQHERKQYEQFLQNRLGAN